MYDMTFDFRGTQSSIPRLRIYTPSNLYNRLKMANPDAIEIKSPK